MNRAVRLCKILDAVALSVSTGTTHIKYTNPVDISRHDFSLDLGFIAVNGGNSTDFDVYYQYGFTTPLTNWTIESASFSGAGLNDLATSGTYRGREIARYKVEVDGEGVTDTYKWSKNDGETWEATTVSMITGTAVELENGVYISFAAKTGHTSGNFWYFHATNITWVANTTKAIDAMNCPASQKYEAETLKPCQWIRFYVDNQDGAATATITLYLIIQI